MKIRTFLIISLLLVVNLSLIVTSAAQHHTLLAANIAMQELIAADAKLKAANERLQDAGRRLMESADKLKAACLASRL